MCDIPASHNSSLAAHIDVTVKLLHADELTSHLNMHILYIFGHGGVFVMIPLLAMMGPFSELEPNSMEPFDGPSVCGFLKKLIV